MNIQGFAAMKQKGQAVSVMTCYDYTSALLIAKSNIDCVLVGDSGAMTMHGFDSTVSATVEMIATMTASVSRGLKSGGSKAFLVADMPFLSNRKGLSDSIEAARLLMQAGAHALKIEGAKGNLELIEHLVASGVPIMGHLGLTPQSVNVLGGYRVQGKTEDSQHAIFEDATALETAGCFALVLECVPAPLAARLTQALHLSTIGIGAGPDCDGQVLVWQDILGLNPEFKPKFVRTYLDGAALITEALNRFDGDVKAKAFPSAEESF